MLRKMPVKMLRPRSRPGKGESSRNDEVSHIRAARPLDVGIRTTRVDHVEDLREGESVKDQSLELVLLVDRQRRVGRVQVQDLVSGKVESERDDELVHRLAQDHDPHLDRDERSGLAVRFAAERLGVGRVRSEGEGGELGR